MAQIFLPESKGMDIMRWLLQLCAFGKSAISEKYPVKIKKRTAFCSTCATKREQAREPGFVGAERWVADGQKGTYPYSAQEGEPCTDCVVCTQFSDVRICPHSTEMYIRKCKAAGSITHGNIWKVRGKGEWKTNHFTLQLSFIINWAKLERCVSLGGERVLPAPRVIKPKMTMQIVVSRELQLQWVHYSSIEEDECKKEVLSVHKLHSRKVRVNTRETFPAGKYVSMQKHVSESKEINL